MYTYLVSYDLSNEDLDNYVEIQKYIEEHNGISLQKSVWLISFNTEQTTIPTKLKKNISKKK